jgi:ABC-2 type transport system permease protein
MLERIRQLLIKEFIHLFRDPRSRIAFILPPLLQMLIFGYAATYEVHNVATAIVDHDRSPESRDFISRLKATGRFSIVAILQRESEIGPLLDHRKAALAIQIEPGFANALRKGTGARVQAILDGTNSNSALITVGYLNLIALRFAGEYQAERVSRISPGLLAQMPTVELEGRPWFNPNLDAQWFFVPGVVASIILTTVLILTAFAVVREREMGTLEQLMVTPIRPYELIIGKTLAPMAVGMFNATLGTVVAVFWFGVPLTGNVAALALGAFLFVMGALGVGLMLSTACSTQQQAFASAFMFTMPSFTLSGFAFPISSMPVALQWLTLLNPLRYFLVLIRAVFLKGGGIVLVWPELAAMSVLAMSTLAIATLRFRKTLD